MILQSRLLRTLPPLVLFTLLFLFLLLHLPQALAAPTALPDVNYTSATNTLSLGKDSSDQPASEVITIPALASALANKGLAALLLDQGNQTWLLKANLVIQRSARLDATMATIKELRLDSPPAAPVTIIARRGGHLLIDGITVKSWDNTSNAVDENITDGRSYLLAAEGGRMDILHSDVSYLGAGSGEPSGLSWRKRLTSDPKTGATGRLEDSKIHHNYFGMYSYEAYGLKILRNEVYSNIYYGIDPHDNSQGFEVAYNKVYSNGTHGIIFSRLCEDNLIHNNEVFNNGQHGIMLDRGTNNNTVYENVVYGNQDGIAIFQSSHNIIRNNTIRQNLRGIRINATYDTDDVYDGISTNNQIFDNLIEDSTEQGVYVYARADRNLFRGNQIVRSGLQGFYIKSGGNRLENNVITSGGVGITIAGGEYRDNPAVALPSLDPSGDNNVMISTTVASNSDVGIRILGGSNNRVGPTTAGELGNRIESNGKDGVAIGDAVNGTAATDNQVNDNVIRNNTRHGVLITDATSVRNKVSKNSITGNGQLGIKVELNAQQGIKPPVVTTSSDTYVRGTALANATIEVYSDSGTRGQRLLATFPAALTDDAVQAAAANQMLTAYSLADYEGQLYLGTTQADGNGVWEFQFAQAQDPEQISVLAIDGQGNTSAFSGSTKGSEDFSIQITMDSNQQKTIQVSGINSEATLPAIKSKLGAADANLLQELPNQTWLLNANILLGIGVTLNLSPDAGVQELRLRSQATVSGQARAANIDYNSFVYLRAHGANINIDNMKVFSWDPQLNDYDRDPSNGRAYLLAKYASVMNIRNSEVGYLGSEDGESYGISWRDVNDAAEPDKLLTRVTGEVLNSLIHHNYYGIYTFQASDMLFRGNQFYDNVRYGFDPHDFSHGFTVENNQAYNNGSHGFIISRGCNNFVFRNNVAYNNNDPSPTSLAHGFMLDPGSPNSVDPQAPSTENLLENNEAYGNEGYGLRILASNNNEIRGNYFHDSEMGISVEQNSTGNVITGNRLNNNTRFGVALQETANKNTVLNNEVLNNGDSGIYVRSNENQIEANNASNNVKAGIALLIKSGFPPPGSNVIMSNTVASNGANGIDLRTAMATLVQGNLVEKSQNKGDGIYLKDSVQTSLVGNVLRLNTGYGIEVSGATEKNIWLRNAIYSNVLGAIVGSGGAVLVTPPQLTPITGLTLSGATTPGAIVEVFADTANQAQFYLGRTTADSTGAFSFVATSWPASNITAIGANASALSTPVVAPEVVPPTPTPLPTPIPSGNLYLPLIQSAK